MASLYQQYKNNLTFGSVSQAAGALKDRNTGLLNTGLDSKSLNIQESINNLTSSLGIEEQIQKTKETIVDSVGEGVTGVSSAYGLKRMFGKFKKGKQQTTDTEANEEEMPGENEDTSLNSLGDQGTSSGSQEIEMTDMRAVPDEGDIPDDTVELPDDVADMTDFEDAAKPSEATEATTEPTEAVEGATETGTEAVEGAAEAGTEAVEGAAEAGTEAVSSAVEAGTEAAVEGTVAGVEAAGAALDAVPIVGDVLGILVGIGGGIYAAVAGGQDAKTQDQINTEQDQQDTIKQQELTNQVQAAKDNFSSANVVGDISTVATPMHVASGVF